MEFRLRLLPEDCCFTKNLHETQGSQSKFHELNIYNIFIYYYYTHTNSLSVVIMQIK